MRFGPVRAVLRRAWWQKLWKVSLKVILAALVAGATWGSLQVRARVERDPRLQLSNWTLHFGPCPEWVTRKIREEIESINENAIIGPGAGDRNLLQEGLLAEIRRELLRTPWVRAVPRIRLYYPGIDPEGKPVPGRLLADLELRRPLAAVWWRGRYYLLDAEGRRLGSDLSTSPFEHFRFPVLAGAESSPAGPPPHPGEFWRSREVLEGLAVARELFLSGINRRFPQQPVRVIDVQNVGGRLRPLEPEILLRTRDFLFGWGRSPVSPGARAMAVHEVLANLEKVLSQPERYLSEGLIRLYTSPLVRAPFYRGIR